MINYDPHHWRTSFFAIHGSRASVIAIRSVFVTLVSLAFVLVHFFVTPIANPAAATIHGLVAPALSLLLVFRTNQSYDRWWEGRKLWGTMVNTCRNLARASSVHLSGERLTRVLCLLREFPVAAMTTLRGVPWEPSAPLHADDLQFVKRKKHVPTALCARITWHLQQARGEGLSDIVFTSLDANNQLLVDVIGACERIHKTPLPFAYVVHLRRALVLVCATLPFSLLTPFGWWCLPVVFAVTFVLLGVEEIGVEIEDPFEGDENDLPLEAITATIQGNVDEYQLSTRTE